MILLALTLAAAPAGAVGGKVTIAGLAPRLANLPVTRDMRICGSAKPDESLVIGPGGGVRDAVLWISDLPAAPAPKADKGAKRPKLDQEACAYVPHVLAAQVGTTIDVVNGDALLHNVRATDGARTVFNYAMPIKGHTIPTHLRKEGFARVQCDVHPWMHATLAVMPNTAFAVTKEDGSFSIEGVPAGRHHVKLWHERLGTREGDVEVQESGTATFDVVLNPR